MAQDVTDGSTSYFVRMKTVGSPASITFYFFYALTSVLSTKTFSYFRETKGLKITPLW